MGCQSSINKDRVFNISPGQDKNMITRLMDAYCFNFSKDLKNQSTFEEKVMLSNSNDLGLPSGKIYNYSPETAHIMITEFK